MRLARVLSYIFHPVFMPFIGVVVIFNSGIYIADIPFEFKRFVYALILLCMVILPLTLLPMLYILKVIQKITLDERQERIIPLIFTTLCFYLAYFLLAKYSPIKLINMFLLSGVLVVFGTLVISLFWKISIHMAGIGGIVALIFTIGIAYTVDMTTYLSLAFLVAGIIATSRLALQLHSIMQVVSGFLLGLLIVGGTMFQLLN